jgi:hypothetical protein
VNDIVREPIAKIPVFRIGALIVERENGYRLRVQWKCFRRGADFTLADVLPLLQNLVLGSS